MTTKKIANQMALYLCSIRVDLCLKISPGLS
jgi:hypothetical protein